MLTAAKNGTSFTDIVHTGYFFYKPGLCKTALYLLQFFFGIRHKRKLPVLTVFQNPRFFFFQINTCHQFHGNRRRQYFITCFAHDFFHDFSRCSLFASDSKRNDLRYQIQRMHKGMFHITVCHIDSEFRLFLIFIKKFQFCRHFAHPRKITGKSDRSSIYQNCGNLFCHFHIRNITTIVLCKHIHCKFMVDIRCCGNHRCSLNQIRNFFCKLVGSSDVSGQQRNDKIALLVYNNHRRIGLFTFYKRCNSTDCDAAGTDKNNGVRIRKPSFCPVTQRSVDGFCKFLYIPEGCIIFFHL